MKGTLKKIRGKAVAAFLCIMVVLANVIPVSAAEPTPTIPPHGCVAIDSEKTIQSYEQLKNGKHRAVYFVVMKCQTCHRDMGSKIAKGAEEAHSLSHQYIDRGHVGENDHMYEVYCKCNYSETIRLITCQWKETGRHVTPW